MDTVIRINLSPASIESAIRKLELYQRRVERRTEELVDVLVDGGAEMARYAFGGTATVLKMSEAGEGIIDASGEHVIIMEFGAGMATMENHPLVHNAPVDVYRWSYSEQVGSGEGYITSLLNNGQGYWHFGGNVYTAVQPRHGMLDARDFIINNLENKARVVFSR